jgi:Cys-rich repeat protein
VCVGCTSNASCPSGTTCNTASGLCVGCTSNANCPGGTYCDMGSGACTPCPAGDTSCAGPGGGGPGAGNVLANGSIEGGSCACDVVGRSGASPGGLAALGIGIVAALRARARRARRRVKRYSRT